MMLNTPKSVLLLLTMAGGVGSASAQSDIFWNTVGNGVWSNPENWSPSVVPNNSNETFNATLGPLGGAYTAQLDIPVTIENFTISEPTAALDVRNQPLTINQSWNVIDGTVFSSLSGGTITVAGETVFGDVVMMNAGQVRANGSLKIAPKNMIDICDTDVDYGGNAQAATWEGNNEMSINMGGSFTNGGESSLLVEPNGDKVVSGDGSGTFTNDGEMEMLELPNSLSIGLGKALDPLGRPSAGRQARVNDTVRFDGANFINNGGVTIQRGTFDLLEVANAQTVNGTLNRGDWAVVSFSGTPSRLLFRSQDLVDTIDTRVVLVGQATQFPAIDAFSTVGRSGFFQIGFGRDFQFQQGLTNLGEIVVGENSVLDAGSGFSNINNGVLQFGTYTISGAFLAPSSDFAFALNRARVRLIGADAGFPAISFLQEIGTESLLSLEDGAMYTFPNGLGLQPGGELRVGAGSSAEIFGPLFNIDGNVLFNGDYVLAGGLRGGIDFITELQQTRIVLSGIESEFLNDFNERVLQFLQLIGPAATFEVRDGRAFFTEEALVVEGTLIVDPSSSINPPPGALVAADDTVCRTVDGLFVEPGSTIQIGVRSAAPGGVGIVEADNGIFFLDGNAGTLRVVLEEGVELPDPFVRTIIRAPLVDGSFNTIEGVGLAPDQELSVVDNGVDGLELRIVRVCIVDLNEDGFVDNGDIGAFIELFFAGDARADLNGDGFIDNGDISTFVSAFVAGC